MTYILTVAHQEGRKLLPGESRWTIFVRKVNIDPKGYPFGEFYGATLNSALNKATMSIHEDARNA